MTRHPSHRSTLLIVSLLFFAGTPPSECFSSRSWNAKIRPSLSKIRSNSCRQPLQPCFMKLNLFPPSVEEKTNQKTSLKSSIVANRRTSTPSTEDSEWSLLPTPLHSNLEDMERWVGKEGDGWERNVLPLGIAAVLASAVAVAHGLHLNLPSSAEAVTGIKHFFENPSASLQNVVDSVQSMGNLGFLYFAVVYTVAEILAIPAIPLTASAGYLFGVQEGTAVVLLSASIAAAVSFVIGRTLLRGYVEGVLEDFPQMQKIDKAIGKEGFKLMLLLRLSPIFPFALSNYLYGATSVRFWPFFFGTMLGFTPGTIAYVYTGEVGKALTLGGSGAQPWYVYAGGFALLGAFLKVAADVATGIIDEIEDE